MEYSLQERSKTSMNLEKIKNVSNHYLFRKKFALAFDLSKYRKVHLIKCSKELKRLL